MARQLDLFGSALPSIALIATKAVESSRWSTIHSGAHLKPIFLFLGTLLASVCLVAFAGKSPEDCQAEIDPIATPVTRQMLIQKCLFEASATPAEIAASKEGSRNSTVFLEDLQISKVNSAGGVEIAASINNPNTGNAIKYLNVALYLYNSVGDRIASDIGRQFLHTISYTGSLKNEDGVKRVHWPGLVQLNWQLSIDSKHHCRIYGREKKNHDWQGHSSGNWPIGNNKLQA
jgi:hypothetical protein